jgi:FkbM family methyltransferase
MKALVSRLTPGDGVIDVGANVGSITTQLARAVGPTGYVLAVEPDASAAEQCEQVCRPWPCVRVRRMAVTDHGGTAAFYRGAYSVHSSLAEANVPTVAGAETVPCDTLDQLAADVPRLRAIKIDAQGAEGWILSGATRLLQRTDLVWVLEIWPEGLRACGSSVRALRSQLAGWSILAHGKRLENPALTWAQLDALADGWSESSHTNVLIGRV